MKLLVVAALQCVLHMQELVSFWCLWCKNCRYKELSAVSCLSMSLHVQKIVGGSCFACPCTCKQVLIINHSCCQVAVLPDEPGEMA